MALPHPLPDDLVELIARRFRVLGEPMRIKLLDRLREGEASVNELRRGARRLAAERLQAPQRAGRGRHPRPPQGGNPRLLPDRRRGRLRALRAGLRLGAAAAARAERARRRESGSDRRRHARPSRHRPRERPTVGPLGRLGRWTADHVRAVAIAWVVVAVALGVFAPRVETALSGAGWQANGSESVQARELIQANFAGLSSSALMVVVHSQRLRPPPTRASGRRVGRVEQLLRANAHVASVPRRARARPSPPTATPPS